MSTLPKFAAAFALASTVVLGGCGNLGRTGNFGTGAGAGVLLDEGIRALNGSGTSIFNRGAVGYPSSGSGYPSSYGGYSGSSYPQNSGQCGQTSSGIDPNTGFKVTSTYRGPCR